MSDIMRSLLVSLQAIFTDSCSLDHFYSFSYNNIFFGGRSWSRGAQFLWSLDGCVLVIHQSYNEQVSTTLKTKGEKMEAWQFCDRDRPLGWWVKTWPFLKKGLGGDLQPGDKSRSPWIGWNRCPVDFLASTYPGTVRINVRILALKWVDHFGTELPWWVLWSWSMEGICHETMRFRLYKIPAAVRIQDEEWSPSWWGMAENGLKFPDV